MLSGKEILGERRETAGERKGRLSKGEERTGGEATFIGAHPLGPLPAEHPPSTCWVLSLWRVPLP